jgi:hypothetical protein
MAKSQKSDDEKQTSIVNFSPRGSHTMVWKSQKEKTNDSPVAVQEHRGKLHENSRMKMRRESACVLSPAFIKICCTGTIVTWCSTLILGVLVAQLDLAGPNFDPAGFNPLIDYLSNMGSINYTPVPCVFNFGMTLTSLLMIPVTFYLKNLMIGEKSSYIRIGLACLFTILMMIGLIFLGFAGLINSELSKTWEEQLFFPLNACNWHLRIASISFSGLVLAGGVFALFSLIYPDFFKDKLKMQKSFFMKSIFILNTCVLTPTFLGFFMSSPLLHSEDLFWITLPLWRWATLWEWCLAMSLTVTMLFVCISLIRPLNLMLKKAT